MGRPGPSSLRPAAAAPKNAPLGYAWDRMGYLSARAAALYCGVSEKTMRRWIADGTVPAERSPEDQRAYLIDQDALDATGRVRQLTPIADIENGTGAALALVEPEQGYSIERLLGYLEDREREAQERAAAAAADAQRWANEAGKWRATAAQSMDRVLELEGQLAEARRPRGHWWRLAR